MSSNTGHPFTLFSPDLASMTNDSDLPLMAPRMTAWEAENPIHWIQRALCLTWTYALSELVEFL